MVTKQNLTTIFTVNVHGFDLLCQLDSHLKPLVRSGDKTYQSLFGLTQAIPVLELNDHLKALAKIANFLSGGAEYQFIEDISKYQEEYLNRVEFEQNSFDYIPNRIIDHGIFDVSVMHPPRIINNELVFYVKNDQNQLPYCVSVAYPITKESDGIRYQLLPYAR